ncbi:hypothetical protein [Kutzneria sp. 744]|uniref:hypothetical protein n=1 Tax=Kutzneria sp. (strain 744) TaxID=345341 RepID=UPI0004B13E37|nr:hypothetical protein [Kutzneria sp. 744]
MKRILTQVLLGALMLLGGAVTVTVTGVAHAGGGVDITGWCRSYYNSSAFNEVISATFRSAGHVRNVSAPVRL